MREEEEVVEEEAGKRILKRAQACGSVSRYSKRRMCRKYNGFLCG